MAITRSDELYQSRLVVRRSDESGHFPHKPLVFFCSAVGNLQHNFIHTSGSSPKHTATIGKLISENQSHPAVTAPSFHHPSISLSVKPSIHLFICSSIHSSIHPSTIHPCICSTVQASTIHPSTHHPSIHLFIHLSIHHPSVHMFIHPSTTHPSIDSSVHPLVNSSIYSSTPHSSIHLYIHNSIHPSIHLLIHYSIC